MKIELCPTLVAAFLAIAVTVRSEVTTSPDGRIHFDFQLTEDGAPRYSVRLGDRQVLRESKLGLVREDSDFSRLLKAAGPAEFSTVRDRYEILVAKRKVNEYEAKQGIFHLANPDGKRLDILVRVSNDEIGFRYGFPETLPTTQRIKEETSSFHFPLETRAWLQPMAVARSGWSECNPSYEEYHEQDIPVGKPSTLGAGWVYPALFRTGDTWVLLSEIAPSRNYCATRLKSDSPDGEYGIGFPDLREVFPGGPSVPESTLPWRTPWRVIVIGSLKSVTESMLGVHLADKPSPTANPAEPGKASWSWPLMGDAKTVFQVQKEFIDYAADMGWHYTLIDAQWDQQIGDEKLKELVDYGKKKNVKILVWYNSAGSWNSTFQTPRSRLLTKEDRKKVFQHLKDLGVAGIKVDFFGGDGQSMIAYQQDILEESAPYGFAINFHGTTLPRGWQRTYPHFMTAEAIRGLECSTFEQIDADRAASHCAMLPFTRNVFDPMDFTPVVLDRINDKIQRKTTSGFELALSVRFTSGIQHYAEIPSGITKAPPYVKEFLKSVPSVWEESRFIAGHPGQFVVMARMADGRWFVSGINAGSTSRKLLLDLSELKATSGTLITDGDAGNLSFEHKPVKLGDDGKLEITLQPSGGFVLKMER